MPMWMGSRSFWKTCQWLSIYITYFEIFASRWGHIHFSAFSILETTFVFLVPAFQQIFLSKRYQLRLLAIISHFSIMLKVYVKIIAGETVPNKKAIHKGYIFAAESVSKLKSRKKSNNKIKILQHKFNWCHNTSKINSWPILLP